MIRWLMQMLFAICSPEIYNNIVSIFCDEDDTLMFLEGYIYAIGRQDFLIKHITPHGLADGYILKKIDSVMHLEISGQYEKK